MERMPFTCSTVPMHSLEASLRLYSEWPRDVGRHSQEKTRRVQWHDRALLRADLVRQLIGFIQKARNVFIWGQEHQIDQDRCVPNTTWDQTVQLSGHLNHDDTYSVHLDHATPSKWICLGHQWSRCSTNSGIPDRVPSEFEPGQYLWDQWKGCRRHGSRITHQNWSWRILVPQ